LASLIAVALAIASCGNGGGGETGNPVTRQNLTAGLSGQERAAAATIDAYLEAFDSGDPAKICPLTSRTEAALERCIDTLPFITPAHPQPPYELRSIKIQGSKASATIVPRSGQGKPVFFQLQRVDGEWKVLTNSLQG
jgi:hypothetical protein